MTLIDSGCALISILANIDTAEMRPLFGQPADAATVEPRRKLTETEVTIDQIYLTADRHHSPMEPSAPLAIWMNQRLVLRDAVQGVTFPEQFLHRPAFSGCIH